VWVWVQMVWRWLNYHRYYGVEERYWPHLNYHLVVGVVVDWIRAKEDGSVVYPVDTDSVHFRTMDCFV